MLSLNRRAYSHEEVFEAQGLSRVHCLHDIDRIHGGNIARQSVSIKYKPLTTANLETATGLQGKPSKGPRLLAL